MILGVLSAIAFSVIAVNGYNGVEEHFQIVAQEQEAAKVAQVVTIDKKDELPVLSLD